MPADRPSASHLPVSKRRIGAVFLAVQATVVLAAASAWAAPGDPSTPPSGTPAPSGSPSPTPSSTGSSYCDMMTGPAKTYCEQGGGNGTPVGNPVPSTGFITDPLGSVAKGCAEAATWIIGKLGVAVNETTTVDFTNPGFLRQYGVVFAASTFLTLILWILAVAKRAVRGVPITTAFSEAIGYLWLAVMASAFTPLVLYMAVSLTDGVTKVIASGTQQDTDKFLGGFGKALSPDSNLGGGPVMLIFLSLLSMAAAAVLWLELLVRAAMLYVGAILGTAVYSGLVDRALWHHVRRWAGLMIAIILLKPVIVIVLGLATAISGDTGQPDAFAAVLSGLAIMILSIFASVLIYRFVPNFGDDMTHLSASRRAMSSGGSGAAPSGPATYLKQGIQTHGSRGSSGGAPATATAVSSGISAHGSRSGDSGSGGSGAASAPKQSSQTATPHARNGKD